MKPSSVLALSLLLCCLAAVRGAIHLELLNEDGSNTTYTNNSYFDYRTLSNGGLLCRSDFSTPDVREWYRPDGMELSTVEIPDFAPGGIYYSENTDTSRGNGGSFLKTKKVLQPNQLGVYRCDIRDTDTEVYSVYVGVYDEKPAVAIARAQKEQQNSENCQFSCTANIATEVNWVKADGSSTPTSSIIVTDTTPGPDGYFSELTTECGDGYIMCTVTAKGTGGTQSASSSATNVTDSPKDITVLPGSNVSFSVTATGTVPLSYQWQKDGMDLINGDNGITGATTDTLTIDNVMQSDEGGYQCVVSNLAGMDISDAAVLNIADQPEVTVHPVDQTNAVPGSKVSFSVISTGTAPLSYQWQKDGVNLPNGDNRITGVTTNTLTIDNVMESDEGDYQCVVSNIAGMNTSKAAMLTVADPPQVTVQPMGQTNIKSGSEVSFSVTATGTAPLSYQWQKDEVDLPNGDNRITGVITDTLTIGDVMESDEGGYQCVVSIGSAMVTSETAMLTVGSGGRGVFAAPAVYLVIALLTFAALHF